MDGTAVEVGIQLPIGQACGAHDVEQRAGTSRAIQGNGGGRPGDHVAETEIRAQRRCRTICRKSVDVRPLLMIVGRRRVGHRLEGADLTGPPRWYHAMRDELPMPVLETSGLWLLGIPHVAALLALEIQEERRASRDADVLRGMDLIRFRGRVVKHHMATSKVASKVAGLR